MKEKFKNIDYVVIPDVPQKFNQAHQDYIIMEMLSETYSRNTPR